MHKVQAKPESALAVLSFFDWSYSNGNEMAAALDYVPMPEKIQKLVRASWKKEIKDSDGKAIWK
jgi:phosphate transport system substrate-binding protein